MYRDAEYSVDDKYTIIGRQKMHDMERSRYSLAICSENPCREGYFTDISDNRLSCVRIPVQCLMRTSINAIILGNS